MTVSWTVKGVPVKVLNSDNETSQVILDTSYNSVYDNRLRVRGRRTGTYYRRISYWPFQRNHYCGKEYNTPD